MITDEEICKVAIIGAGYMAEEHIKVFSSIDNVNLCGIHSRTKIKAEKLAGVYKINKVYDTISDLFSETKAELVIITVPELSAKEVCVEAFNFPWVCLIEKPVGYNLKDSKDILDCAEKKKAKAYVALNRRHYSATNKVQNFLDDENSKRIISIIDQEDQKAALKSGQPELVVENWMYANSIHLIDLFRIFGRGEIINVNTIKPWLKENPFHLLSYIEFESGDIGIYNAYWNCPGPWSISVTTSSKRLEMRPIETLNIQEHGSRTLKSIDLDKKDIDFKPGLWVQALEALKAVRGSSHSLPDLHDAYASMELISKIYC